MKIDVTGQESIEITDPKNILADPDNLLGLRKKNPFSGRIPAVPNRKGTAPWLPSGGIPIQTQPRVTKWTKNYDEALPETQVRWRVGLGGVFRECSSGSVRNERPGFN